MLQSMGYELLAEQTGLRLDHALTMIHQSSFFTKAISRESIF